jgi:protein-tyrosine kinase
MSLIEKALGKARAIPPGTSGAEIDTSATTGRRLALKMPSPRQVADPRIRVTQAMLETLGLRAPPEQEHQRASEYREIKRRVVTDLRANDAARVIVVASALAGEGKSFTAANLARSLALEPDHAVLLIDADVIKPRISECFGVVTRPGLMDALVDPARNVEDMVLATDIEGLSVLPAGAVSENATEYFASDRMRDMLNQLRAVPNRIIVIDTLPLLQTTEARAIAPLAGQVLLVVRAESTQQSAVEAALAVLGKLPSIKLVLNATVRTRLSRYLGHSYGYDYDYRLAGRSGGAGK